MMNTPEAVDLSIVIPIYNSRNLIEDSLRRLTTFLNSLSLNYEILLRDDGSTDGSREILTTMPQKYPKTRIFFNLDNRGLGFTLIELFQSSRGTNVIYMDCDLPFGENIVSVLLDEMKDCDIAIASRYKGIRNHIRWDRKIASRLYYLFCRILFNIPIIDIGSGSVMMSRKVLNEIHLKKEGFGIHGEIYVKASKKNFRMKELPASTKKRQPSTFSILRHGPHIITETLQLWFEMKEEASFYGKFSTIS